MFNLHLRKHIMCKHTAAAAPLQQCASWPCDTRVPPHTPSVPTYTCAEPDDLGFLAMWKRLMTRKQQLAADAESARAASQQLRSTVSQLQDKLREEGAARQAAVAARAELEVKLQEAERKAEHWLVSGS
jgi:uncharacterized protein (DUF2342 family)